MLQENGYELATATNGSDGLRLFMSRPVDAVVLEHQLSHADGTAIADEIKQARPEIPIVMLVDHMEMPSTILRSVDALVAKSDGAHFLWATVHFVLNAKPARRGEAKLSAEMPETQERHEVSRGAERLDPASSLPAAAERDAPFSRELWQRIHDGEINF
jgi:DNA-binding response OmpR family regulator